MKKYLEFSSIDLAQETSFIRWAKGLSTSDDWESWIEDNPSQSEKVQEAKSLVLSIKFKEYKTNKELENKLWNNINQKLEEIPVKQTSRRKIIRMGMAAAAACMALYLVFDFSFNDQVSIQTSFAKTKEISLPDGSMVTLNTDSKIKYSKGKWSANRVLTLEGEAFFQVKRGSEFKVNTKQGVVTVLGTSFNVFARKDNLNVQCETGSVKVESGKNETILKPNQAILIAGNSYDFKDGLTPINYRSSWRTGMYGYRNKPLIDVLEELERQLDLKVRIDNKYKGLLFSGSFDTKNGEEALSEVLWPLNLDYTKEGNIVTIIKK